MALHRHILSALAILRNLGTTTHRQYLFATRSTLHWSATNPKKVLIVALGVIVVIGIAVALPRPARRELIPANFARVEKGMSRSLVIAILGGPPGDYTNGRVQRSGESASQWACEKWICNDGELRVLFDSDDMVRRVSAHPVTQLESPSLFSRIRSHFGI
jgi:hypothetical protein